MKPRSDTITTNGNLPGQTREFQIDPRATAHFMRMFTNLYSDVELAVIRELSNNALDSHIFAGNPRPIEVTTPNPMSNFLVIRDFGVGLSVDELFDLFSMYGASTKRESDEVTGMLGVGSKSPLAYGSTFTMIARKDGVEATVAITKNEKGVGQLHVVDTVSTNEHNGVEIRVPARNPNQFADKAANLFKYWDEGTVLLNGKAPQRFEGMPVADDLWLVKHDRYNGDESIIIQGNVPYPAGSLMPQHKTGLPYGYAIVAKVPIGTVEPTPSRESLEQNPATVAAANALVKRFSAKLTESIQANVEAAPSVFEAVKVTQEWAGVLNHRRATPLQWKYRGADLPTGLKSPTRSTPGAYSHNSVPTGRIVVVDRHRSGRGSHSNYPAIDNRVLMSALVVTGYAPGNFTPTHRQKIAQWLDRHVSQHASLQDRTAIQKIVLVDFAADVAWLPAERVVNWATIAAEKLPRKVTGASGRIPGSFDLLVGEGLATARPGSTHLVRRPEGVPGDQIDQTNPVYYMHGNQLEAERFTALLNTFGDKWTIVCLPANRIDKFKRESPHVKNIKDEVMGLAKKAADAATDDERLALAIEVSGHRRDLQALKGVVSQIDDGDIVEAVRLSLVAVDRLRKVRERFMHLVAFPLPEWDTPMRKYPLYDTYEVSRNPAHVVRYLNSEFAYLADQAAKGV